MPEENKGMKVPAKAKHKVKVITASNKKDLEKETNDFLDTISDERRLNSSIFTINPKTGEMVNIINYSEISPMTAEEWKEKQSKQAKFAAPFLPKDLMPSGEKVENL